MPRTHRYHRALLAALFTLMPLGVAAAQSLTPGKRVRVKSNQVVAPIVGSYQGMRRDTVVVIEDGVGAKIWSFNTTAVDQIEVSVGMKGGNRDPMIRWALIGAAVGGSIGLITAATLENSTDSRYNEALSTLLGAAMGAGFGAFYGSRKLQEHWAAVPIPRRVGVVPSAHGLRIGLSASF
jgi:hypothetical protein